MGKKTPWGCEDKKGPLVGDITGNIVGNSLGIMSVVVCL